MRLGGYARWQGEKIWIINLKQQSCPIGTTGRKKVNMEYCHYDYDDEHHDCLDYMECEECPYYADLD